MLRRFATAVIFSLAEKASGIPIVTLQPITAEVHPTLVGILQYHCQASADVGATVKLVPNRHWNFEQVDIRAVLHIFQNPIN